MLRSLFATTRRPFLSSLPPVASLAARSMSAMPDAASSKVKLGLCQVLVGMDKTANLASAAVAVREAAGRGAQIVSLPECFNAPYAVDMFAKYAEEIPAQASEINDEQVSHLSSNAALHLCAF
jgi:omega-amidase